MRMRLLKKSEIKQKQTAERKLDIDEGIKIAKKVDNLRELAVKEEKSLELLRANTLETIQGEINEKISKRDVLVGEVKLLEERKEEALAPLTKEQDKIDNDTLTLEKRQEVLDTTILESNELKEEAEKRNAQSLKQETKAEEMNKLADDLYGNAVQTDLTATNNKKDAQETLDNAQKYENALTARLNEQESILTQREKTIKTTTKTQEDEKDKLDSEWRKLADRKAMFKRNLNRK